MIKDTTKALLLEAFPDFDYYLRKIMLGPIFDSAIMEWWASWNTWSNAKIRREEQGFTDQKADNPKVPNKITLVRNGKLIYIFISYDIFLQLFSIATGIYIEGSPEDVAFLKKSILESFKETGLEKIYERIMLRLRNEYGEPYPVKRFEPIKRPEPKKISL